MSQEPDIDVACNRTQVCALNGRLAPFMAERTAFRVAIKSFPCIAQKVWSNTTAICNTRGAASFTSAHDFKDGAFSVPRRDTGADFEDD